MLSTVNFQDGQIATEEDFRNLGAFPRKTFDTVIKDMGGWPASRFAAFPVDQTGNFTVRVGAGRLYSASGVVYNFEAEGGQTIDMLDHKPTLAKKIALIVVHGNQNDTDVEPREFVISVEDGTTEGREVAVESRRVAIPGVLYGPENATPSPPAMSSDYVAVAQVLLNPAGIESITMLPANRVPSIYNNGILIDQLSTRLALVGPQIDTLRTDISGIGLNLRSKASQAIVRDIAHDVAILKDVAELPDDHVDYGADRFFNENDSDKTASGYSARIFRGLRFPAAGSVVAPIRLANANDPLVKNDGNMLLPVHSHEVRLAVVGKDSEYPLTNTTSTTKTLRTVTEARTVTVASGSETVRTFTGSNVVIDTHSAYRGMELPSNAVKKQSWSMGYGDPASPSGYEAITSYEIPKYTQQTYYETRNEWVENTVNVTGSFTAQSFLNSQEGYLTGVDLYFSQKASSGDVRVMLVDVDPAGYPMFDRVFEQAVIPAADIKIYPEPTPVTLKPAHLLKGGRYAIVLASSSPHFVCQVHGNKFAQGALYYYQDGNFVQAASDRDMAFRVKFARFNSAIVTLALEPLELSGGIDSIRINADVAIPEGTAIDFQVRVNNEWRSIGEGIDGTNVLADRPSLVQFRAVMIGTTDAMPALGLGASRSEVTLTRPSTAFKHVSNARILSAATDQVTVRVKMYNWDDSLHQLTCSLLAGPTYAGIETADATTTKEEGVGTHVRTFVFNVAAVEQFKIELTGSINGSPKWFHVGERLDIEF